MTEKGFGEWSLSLLIHDVVKWGKNCILQKGITTIFPSLRRYFSITVCCLFTYIFHLPFLWSDTNRRKFTSNVVKKRKTRHFV
jgi:hypothetical protein